MSLEGKVALVTGAAQGLGKAFSEILLKNGAKVCLSDFNETEGAKTTQELAEKFDQSKVTFVKCDVATEADFKNAFSTAKSKLGGIDIVINNAGIGIEKDGWEATVNVNLIGTIRGTNLALEHMRKDKGGNGGVIVNVASMAGLRANPCGPVYNATKAAIIQFSQSWAMNPELPPNGMRINTLAPAFAQTALVTNLQDTVQRPDIAGKMVAAVGVMPVETVAEALLELVTDESKHGAILTVSAATGKVYHTAS